MGSFVKYSLSPFLALSFEIYLISKNVLHINCMPSAINATSAREKNTSKSQHLECGQRSNPYSQLTQGASTAPWAGEGQAEKEAPRRAIICRECPHLSSPKASPSPSRRLRHDHAHGNPRDLLGT